MAQDDFASLFESTPKDSSPRATPRLENGQKVEGTVLAISGGLVVVDIGGSADATIELSEFDDVAVAVGDKIVATVAQARKDGPRLTRSLGRGGTAVSSDVLRLAHESQTPVSGTVTAAVKGGFSVEIATMRAFCPISQIDLSYVTEPETFVGQTFDFLVIEFKEGGKNIVVSRRKLLELAREEAVLNAASRLNVGSVVEGTVKSVVKSGCVIDLGGIDGFVHISELARTRVENPLDVVSIGETVQAQVLSVEQTDRGLSVRLSLKALVLASPSKGPSTEEVLAAKVVRHVGNGLIVSTSHGDGLVPTRELALPPGADHRRTYPVGRELEVVLVSRDSQTGRLRFSVDRVMHVEERNNYRDFGSSAQTSAGLGSLGELMASKLGSLAGAPASQGPTPGAGSVQKRGGRR